jgi:hypothetical protein
MARPSQPVDAERTADRLLRSSLRHSDDPATGAGRRCPAAGGRRRATWIGRTSRHRYGADSVPQPARMAAVIARTSPRCTTYGGMV